MRSILVLVLLWSILPFRLLGQPQKNDKPELGINSVKQHLQYWNTWLSDLYDMGIRNENDTIKINKEVTRLLKDSLYRKLVYPETYSIALMVQLMKSYELKTAFWHMINIYQYNDTLSKNIVLRTIFAYDSLMEMDRVLISVFYTYCFTDPTVTQFRNGKPEITRPDILQRKFSTLKEMISYIFAYRKTQQAK